MSFALFRSRRVHLDTFVPGRATGAISAYLSVGMPLACFTFAPRLNAPRPRRASRYLASVRMRRININRSSTTSRWVRREVDDPRAHPDVRVSGVSAAVHWSKAFERAFYFLHTARYISRLDIFFKKCYSSINKSHAIRVTSTVYTLTP